MRITAVLSLIAVLSLNSSCEKEDTPKPDGIELEYGVKCRNCIARYRNPDGDTLEKKFVAEKTSQYYFSDYYQTGDTMMIEVESLDTNLIIDYMELVIKNPGASSNLKQNAAAYPIVKSFSISYIVQ